MPLQRQTVNGRRVYSTPDGKSLPSVTSILSATEPEEKREALNNWRKRVGMEKAQEISTAAASRGTRMHGYLEHFIKNGEMKDLPNNPFAQPSWFMAAEIILKGLLNVDDFWGVEIPLYYSEVYAGTTDCCGIWKGKASIIDFKQSNRPKKREWISDYFLQTVFYGTAHNNMYGTDINTGVILMCVQPKTIESTPEYQEFVVQGDEWQFYEKVMWDRIQQFYSIQ